MSWRQSADVAVVECREVESDEVLRLLLKSGESRWWEVKVQEAPAPLRWIREWSDFREWGGRVGSEREVVHVCTPSVRQAVRRRVGTASRVEWGGGGAGKERRLIPSGREVGGRGRTKVCVGGPARGDHTNALAAVGGRVVAMA